MLFAKFMPRSTCLYALCNAYAQIYMLMCSLPFSCVQIYMLIVMPHFFSLLSLDTSLSCISALQVGCSSRFCGLGLHPYTQAYIKGFGSFSLCIYMLSSYYFLYPCLTIQIQVFPCLMPSVGLCLLVFRATCLCVITSIPIVVCLDVTACEVKSYLSSWKFGIDLDQDHTLSKAKPQSPIHLKPQNLMPIA